jgi:hypothetical protein
MADLEDSCQTISTGGTAADLGLLAQKRQAKQELEAKPLEGLHGAASQMTDADWSALREGIYERNPQLRGQ